MVIVDDIWRCSHLLARYPASWDPISAYSADNAARWRGRAPQVRALGYSETLKPKRSRWLSRPGLISLTRPDSKVRHGSRPWTDVLVRLSAAPSTFINCGVGDGVSSRPRLVVPGRLGPFGRAIIW
jgi:hypothetical protein